MPGPSLDSLHTEEARAFLLEQFKDKVSIRALLDSFTAQIQLVENALWQLVVDRTIDTAVGTQLDRIGEILNRERGSDTDSDYRDRLKIQILINLASGTVEDIVEVFDRVVSPAEIQLRDGTDADFTIEVNDPITHAKGVRLAAYLDELRAAAVGALVYWHESAIPFGFLGDPDALGFGAGEFGTAG
jgi:hypothetical protein